MACSLELSESLIKSNNSKNSGLKLSWLTVYHPQHGGIITKWKILGKPLSYKVAGIARITQRGQCSLKHIERRGSHLSAE